MSDTDNIFIHNEAATPAEAIKAAEEMQDIKQPEFDPNKNPDVISIIKQKDGNYKVFGQKNNKLITLREGKPEDALGRFLTHE